jgi:hypothetical protein
MVDAQLELQRESVSQVNRGQAIESVWRQWIDYEVRQRLRAACFVLDVHQSISFEQNRCEPRANAENLYIAHTCPQSLWTAGSAQEWYELVIRGDYTATQLSHPEKMNADQINALPLSTQCVSLLATTSLLPSKIQRPTASTMNNQSITTILGKIHTSFSHLMTAHSYLAIYHTPIRRLLALTGKTWVLNHKLTNHAEIDALVPTIRMWAASSAAAQATWHACQVLRILFTNPIAVHTASQWWSTYTATLIIWGFGHRAATTLSAATGPVSSRGSSNTLNAPEEIEATRKAALLYIDRMLEFQPRDLASAPMRQDTDALLDAARWKLEDDAVVGTGRPCSALLLDAVGVLERLREGRKLF